MLKHDTHLKVKEDACILIEINQVNLYIDGNRRETRNQW